MRVIAMMEENPEDPPSTAEIAQGLGIPARQLERLFGKYGRSPLAQRSVPA